MRPCDDGRDLDPPPPRERTWEVHDRQADACEATFESRHRARVYARGMNGAEHSSPMLKAALIDVLQGSAIEVLEGLVELRRLHRWRIRSVAEEALSRRLIEPRAPTGHKLSEGGRFAAFELARRKAHDQP